jgi:isopropylmalate/homocitrate/citramalate synthase
MSVLGDLPPRVTVYEVGPRDGLQNQPLSISTETKCRFINMLAAAGLPVVETTSYVRPGAIPQLADAEVVVSGLDRSRGSRFTALIPNMRGMERAAEADLDGIAVFTAASESFSRRNTNASVDETLERFAPVFAAANEARMWKRAYVSTAFGCPYEGDVDVAVVADVSERLAALGADEIAISDTIGVATPRQVVDVVGAVAQRVPMERLALHFHDTRGTALANVLAGLELGITTFDSSTGGLGGCPYAPGASGNLATEDLVYMLDGLGIETGVDLARVVEATASLAAAGGTTPASRYFQAATA